MANEDRTPNQAKPEDTVAAPGQGSGTKLEWDGSQMTSSYANAVNVVSTQEEVMIFFGTNQTWDSSENGVVTVSLTDRIILNPLAAQRLQSMLDSVLRMYEERYGKLTIR